ncbi:hypothetical protein WA158_006813 [Blastocystis sp. Blastoise]
MIRSEYPNGLVVMITGANSGLGYQTAVELATLGVTLVITCRSIEKCNETKIKIIEITGNQSIYALDLELGDPLSIKSFPEKYESLNVQVDVLLNNAGISMIFNHTLSSNQEELNMDINCLSTLSFTKIFLPYLKKSSHPRLLFTTSLSIKDYTLPSLSEEAWNTNKEHYHWYKAYAKSKFWLTAYAIELSKKETSFPILLIDPGTVATNIARQSSLSNIFQSCLGKTLFPAKREIDNSVYCILNPSLSLSTCTIYHHKHIKPFPKAIRNDKCTSFIYDTIETKLN